MPFIPAIEQIVFVNEKQVDVDQKEDVEDDVAYQVLDILGILADQSRGDQVTVDNCACWGEVKIQLYYTISQSTCFTNDKNKLELLHFVIGID